MFRDRADAALRLAEGLRGRDLYDPLVLAIPRGGVVTGAVLAEELDADLDVVLSRKLRAPGQLELAIGAIGEDGDVHLNSDVLDYVTLPDEYLASERAQQIEEISRRQELYRRIQRQAPVGGRSVIVTDDGIATGATMIAALQTIRSRYPKELIAAVPVAPASNLNEIKRYCDEVVCLIPSEHFWAVGQFYQHFEPVDDEQIVRLLRQRKQVRRQKHVNGTTLS